MTLQERIDLGARLAKAQIMVMRAFRTRLVGDPPKVIAMMVNELVESLASSNPQQRFRIIDGTESCIDLLGDRYRQASADGEAAEHVARIERTLHAVVTRAIDRIIEYDVAV